MWRAFYSILFAKLLNSNEKTTQISLQIYSNLLGKLLKSNEKTTQISLQNYSILSTFSRNRRDKSNAGSLQ